MKELPLFLKLKGKPCLLLGTANHAQHKLNMLLMASAKIHIINPHFGEEMKKKSPTIIALSIKNHLNMNITPLLLPKKIFASKNYLLHSIF